MRVVSISGGHAFVSLDAEECELIAYACKDDSTSDNPSISAALAATFGSLAHVVPLTVDAE